MLYPPNSRQYINRSYTQNFALLELLRSEPQKLEWFESLTKIGHSASEMVGFVNQVLPELGEEARCPELIISGGISDFLEGYYLISKVDMPAIYGQASAFLKHARGDYETLQAFVEAQIAGLELAYAYLTVKH